MKLKNWIPYIVLTWKETPKSDENIHCFECVTAVIISKDTGLYFALEFSRWIFWLVGWAIESWEDREYAIVREVEEESGYKNAKIIWILFDKFYSRWFKTRKSREEEALDRVYIIEVEDKHRWDILWFDYWTKGFHWFNEKQMLEKLTLDHHLHYFKTYLKNK